jgi:putative ABC transport system substrate-binding protein
MMDRRVFVIGLGAVLAAAPFAVEGQQTGKVYRVGFLSGTTVPDLVGALRQGLRELGWIEGQNVVIEERSAEEKLQGCLSWPPSLSATMSM